MAGAACNGRMRMSHSQIGHDLQGPGSSCLFGDGSCWDLAGGWCPLHGSSLLRAVITADCMSHRPALIGLSLSMCWGGGAGLCGAAMATGPFNENEHAVTNDIPEPIGYTANGQFAASLTLAQQYTNTKAHTSAWSLNRRQFLLYLFFTMNQYMTSGLQYLC